MEFEEMFKSEQNCIDYLESLRCPNGFECSQCGSIRFWKKNKGRYECSDCHKETTVTANIMLHKSAKPLLIWFHAIWWMRIVINDYYRWLVWLFGIGRFRLFVPNSEIDSKGGR